MKCPTLLLSLLLCATALAAKPLAGTYTIGGPAPDFRSLTDAIAHLQREGVSGAVTFEIRPGIYNEIVAIGAVPGATKEQRITLRGIAAEGEMPTIRAISTADTLAGALLLRDAAHLTIQNLHLTHAPGGAISVVSIVRSTDVEIIGCRIEGFEINRASSRTGTLLDIVDASNLRIARNVIRGGNQGIAVGWKQLPDLARETEIDSNTIEHVFLFGILLQGVAGTVVRENTIVMESLRLEGSAVKAAGCTGRTTIEGNRITFREREGFGIHLYHNVQSTLIRLANNMVVMELGEQLRRWQYAGICVDHTSPVEIYHNSVQVRTDEPFLPKPSALMIIGSDQMHLAIVGNILACNDGPALLFTGAPGAWKRDLPGIICDYNDLFGADTSTGLIYTSREMGFQPMWTLDKWRHETGWDLHSIAVDPGFKGRFDLHATSRALKGAGTAVPVVPADIDGEPRDSLRPDIGADELPK